MSLSITVTGEEATIAALKELSKSVRKRMVQRAATAALKPLVKTARDGVPVGTGNLKKSIGVKKVRRNKAGQYTLLVGARAGYKWAYAYANGENDPVRYANPVEWGHKTKDGGFVPPAGFLRNAYNLHRVTVVEQFAVELRERIAAWNKAQAS